MPSPAPGTPVEGCAHPKQHDHGTRHAYQRCCKCETCAEANRLYHRTYARKQHGWGPRVDAAGVRAHVARLRATGTPLWWIADRSGVSLETISALSRQDRPTITRATHDLLMAVEAAPGVFRGNRMESTSTRRKLRHLALMGWPTRQVAAVSGVNARHLASIRQGDQRFVTNDIAERIARATRELIVKEPAPSQPGTVSKNLALRNGWVSMFAYDDINDPTETPSVVPITLGRIEGLDARTDELRHLLNGGAQPDEAATRAGYPNLKAAISAVRHRNLTVLEHLLTGTAA